MGRKLIVLVFLLSTFSCAEKTHDLDLEDIQKVIFLDLPEEVKAFISNNIDSISNAKNDFYYSTDPNLEFTYGRGGVAKNWFGSINSNYHHFFIEGVHYKLRGNRGHPFILHQGYLYFCQLNLYSDDFKNQPYFMVQIPEIR